MAGRLRRPSVVQVSWRGQPAKRTSNACPRQRPGGQRSSPCYQLRRPTLNAVQETLEPCICVRVSAGVCARACVAQSLATPQRVPVGASACPALGGSSVSSEASTAEENSHGARWNEVLQGALRPLQPERQARKTAGRRNKAGYGCNQHRGNPVSREPREPLTKL